jgi:HEAT repeat protein
MDDKNQRSFYSRVKPVWPYIVFITVFIIGVLLIMRMAYGEEVAPEAASPPPLVPIEATEEVAPTPVANEELMSLAENLRASPDTEERVETSDKLVVAGAAAISFMSPLLVDADPGLSLRARRVVERIVLRDPGAANAVALLVRQPPVSLAVPDITPSSAGLFSALRDIEEAWKDFQDIKADRLRWQDARRFLVQQLMWCGSSEEVPLLAGLVDDANDAVGHAALQALATIPGHAATEAVAGACNSGYKERARAALARLGERGDPSARDHMIALSRNTTDRSTRWTGLGALALNGVMPQAALRPDSAFSAEDNARYADLTLRALGVAEARGETKGLATVYRQLAEQAGKRHQQRVALLGLSRVAPDQAAPLALGYLNTPGLRATAIQCLAGLPKDKSPFLEKTYAQADPTTQAGLLYVFEARDMAALPGLLETAAMGDHPTLRYAAADLQDALPPADDLLWLSQRGGPWVRDRALRAYLDLAHANAIGGGDFEARMQFLNVAEGPYGEAAVSEALDGLAGVAQPEDKDLAIRFINHPDLAGPAGRLLAAIIPMESDPQQAEETLTELTRVVDKDSVRAAAVEALASMGAETESLVSQAGYVTQWQVLGPLPEDAGDSLEVPIISPREADAGTPFTFAGIEYVWKPVTATGVPASVNLQNVFGPFDSAHACMLARVTLPGWVPALLEVGVTDPCVVWLNGEIVHRVDRQREFRAGADNVPVKLRPGTNRIYIQMLQQGGAWRYGVRLTDRRGNPLDLTQARPPDDGLGGVGVRLPSNTRLLRDNLP